jgi:MFS family permease
VPSLLRENRPFRRYWCGETISLFGDQITVIALPLTAVLELHASAAEMGYLAAAAWLPYLFLSLHAGAWVDRRGERRKLMIVADVGRALLLATVPLAAWAGALSMGQLYTVAILTGAFSCLFFVAYPAFFVSIVPRERYIEGNSLVHGSRAFSFVAGPSTGGLLVQLLSAPAALLVDAVSFVGSALFLGAVDAPEVPTEPPGRGHLVAGARWIWGSAVVRSSLLATATINFFNFVFAALFILYATTELHVQAAALGLVLGAGAVGGLLGSAVTGRVTRRIGVGPAFFLGCVLFPAPLILVPLAEGPRYAILAALFAAEFGAGFGVMVLDISIGAIRAAVTPDRLRSRVSGAYMVVNYGVRPLGSLAGGLLGTAIGLRPTLWIATVGAVAGCLWLLPSPLPRMRELPATET